MSVYQTTCCHIQDDCNLHNHCCQNFNPSYIFIISSVHSKIGRANSWNLFYGHLKHISVGLFM